MLTEKIKQAWLDWNTQTLNNFKDIDVDDWIQANDFNLSEDEEYDLLKLELVVEYKKDKDKLEGSSFVKVSNNITLGCISQGAKDLLSDIMEKWDIQYKGMKELSPDHEPDFYGFTYWLCRWSGLIKANKE